MSNDRMTMMKTKALLVATLGVSGALAGCATGVGGPGSGTGATALTVSFSGKVHGGQQPVTGATIQMYTVGTSGLKSASTSMIASTVTTDTTGSFNITGAFSCTSSSATQVYITASGGNPGAGTNSASTMVAALGACTGLTPTTFIWINEETTVAAAYALAPFAADMTHVGASGSNPSGLVNAFTNAAVLANTANGTPGGSLGAGVTVPAAELNTLSDILAGCINTTGAASSSCTTLFAATGASETFGAALAIAKNPGASAITALYTMATPTAPFQPTLTSQPNDFTVAVSSTGNGTLATPYGIAIDASGNAWVTNESGSAVTELGVGGAVVASPTATGMIGAQGIALDRTGNVWVANTAGNSVVKFTLTSGAVTATNSYTAGAGPSAIALDSASNAWVANFNGNSVTELSSAGATVGTYTGSSNNIVQPQGIALSAVGAIYVTSGNGSVVNLSHAGAFVATLNDGTLQGAAAVAVDTSNRVLATGFTTGTAVGGALSQFAANGAAVASSPFTTGITRPAGVATDGTSIFVANDVTSGGLAQFAYASAAPVSPTAGYGGLNAPVGVAIDASGCVWTTNSGSNTVTKLIGLAVPVVTPLAANVGP